MTLAEWLRDRTPAPPPRLAERIHTVLAERTSRPVNEAPELCVEAAAELLHDLLARPTTGRASALDLLTVDALVTYAFEAAASDPATVEARAAAAMSRLSLVTQ
jgi:hypothetical protein